MKLDIDLSEKSTTNNLPDQAQDQVLTALSDISRADVHNGAPNSLCGGDNDVVVFGDLERVERFARGGLVEDTVIDRFWYGVVDEFTEDQTVSAFVEELHGICGDG